MHCKVALLGAQSTSGKREAQVVGADQTAVLIYDGSRRTEGEDTLMMTIRDRLGATDEIVPVSVMMEGEGQSGQGPGYGGQGEEDEMEETWRP